ncbi:hypothetical protein AHAS_Ahas13G0170700 [Arachis hypogaea]
MLQLENQRLQVLAKVMFDILQQENQRLNRHASSLLCICILLDTHPDQPTDQVDPETMEEDIPGPIPEEDIPIEHILVSSSEPSSKEPLTASISGPMSVGQTCSTSARAPPETIEISDDEDKDPEECLDVIMISSNDDS